MSAAYNAAGQMVRSATSDSDVVRWYDGNGRELKRFTSILAEDEIGNHWMKESEKYYIRSSVLGNEVVSEVWSNGRKCKTFVRAAGAEIAWQSAHASETAALSETVFFEYADASGMSQRTSDKNGVVMYGDGGEGSPVETDPMGNNVGTATPYIELLPPREPPPEYPMLVPLMDDSPMYVNGQRVSCTLDGMSIGCSQAMSMMEHGSAIPAALAPFQGLPGFRFEGTGLGIFTTFIPGHWVDISPRDTDPTRVQTTNVWLPPQTSTIYFDISWLPNHEMQQDPKDQDTGNLSDCLKKLLDSYFPSVNVNGQRWRPALDSLFIAGFSDRKAAWVTRNANPFISSRAVTLGIKDIYYEPKEGSIDGRSEDSMRLVIEELYHVNQFLRNWYNLPEGTPYEKAVSSWEATYIIEAAKAGASYDNYLETQAKAQTDNLIKRIERDYGSKTPCKRF